MDSNTEDTQTYVVDLIELYKTILFFKNSHFVILGISFSRLLIWMWNIFTTICTPCNLFCRVVEWVWCGCGGRRAAELSCSKRSMQQQQLEPGLQKLQLLQPALQHCREAAAAAPLCCQAGSSYTLHLPHLNIPWFLKRAWIIFVNESHQICFSRLCPK